MTDTEKTSGSPPKRGGYRDKIARMRLLDDEYMRKFFELDQEHNGCKGIEYMLRILTGIKDLKVRKLFPQRELNSPVGRIVRLDVFCIDSKKRRFNVEIQRGGSLEEIIMRARSYRALLDANALKAVRKPTTLRDTYIIFITEHDIFHGGKPVYHINFHNEEMDEIYDEGTYIIYANAAYNGDDEQGKLMHDLRCADVGSMNESPLKMIAGWIKEPKGDEEMSGVFDEWREEIVQEVTERIRAEEQLKMVNMIRKLMRKQHCNADEVADTLDLSEDERRVLLPLV